MSSDGIVKFWDVRTKACFNEVKGLGDALSLAWAPDGETLVVGNKVFFIIIVFVFILSLHASLFVQSLTCCVSCPSSSSVSRRQ